MVTDAARGRDAEVRWTALSDCVASSVQASILIGWVGGFAEAFADAWAKAVG